MNTLLLIIVIIMAPMQSFVKRLFTDKLKGDGTFTFSTILTFVTMLFFVFSIRKGFFFDKAILPYSVGFAAAYVGATVFAVLAVLYGSLSLTVLMISYSSIIPAIYGIIFCGEKVTLNLIIGLILLVISLYLINFNKEDIKFSVKWLVFVILATVSNGMCSTVQKMSVTKFEGLYSNEFMIIALLIGTIITFIIAICSERKKVLEFAKKSALYALLAGICDGVVNILVLYLNQKISASIMFPLISVGGIVLTVLVSGLFLKEKLSKRQNIGIAIGAVSILFLSI